MSEPQGQRRSRRNKDMESSNATPTPDVSVSISPTSQQILATNKEDAWITLYHALFIVDRAVNGTNFSLPTLPSIWVAFNAYFTSRNNPEVQKLLGETTRFEPKDLLTWRNRVETLLPRTTSYVATLRNESEALIPLITEEMLVDYIALKERLSLPSDPDFGNQAALPADVQDFLTRCLVDPFLGRRPPPQPKKEMQWYSGLTADERQR
ncbi:unnamed protein product [Periconia digitata]|uniref:Uncharacterized protein n=1 Tax=Periconia digitata TaxID=1303443 RepID=A0A9W4XGG4_9PLEO|nr:unnamed protein product [Periconia digitata]